MANNNTKSRNRQAAKLHVTPRVRAMRRYERVHGAGAWARLSESKRLEFIR